MENKPKQLETLRHEIEVINQKILDALCERARLVASVFEIKRELGMELYDPDREQQMIEKVVQANKGPFPDDTIRKLFREIFSASLGYMENESEKRFRVCKRPDSSDIIVQVGSYEIGKTPILIAGPCAVESREQMETVAAALKRLNVGLMRGGAFKPRTSPYSFQGLGEDGLRILRDVAERYGLATVTEVVDPRVASMAADYVDMLQIGTRNMANYELLKAVAATGRPVLLKRGFAATLDEFLQAAEYIAASGNEQIVLCERGIRTFNHDTRFTLDISAVPLLKRSSRLPVIVDVSHAAGRRDIITPLARAALAAGSDGVMVEVHPYPMSARSDAEQQLDLLEFENMVRSLAPFFQ